MGYLHANPCMQPGDGAAWHSREKKRNSRVWAAELKGEQSRAAEPALRGGFASSVLSCGTVIPACGQQHPLHGCWEVEFGGAMLGAKGEQD